MRTLNVLLLLAALFLTSCVQMVPMADNPAYAKAIRDSKPKHENPIGQPVKLESHKAQAYKNGVYLWSHDGATKPFEIWTFDYNEDMTDKAVYTRSGPPLSSKSWRVWHDYGWSPGVYTIPNTMPKEDAEGYFTMAKQARSLLAAPKAKPVKPVLARKPIPSRTVAKKVPPATPKAVRPKTPIPKKVSKKPVTKKETRHEETVIETRTEYGVRREFFFEHEERTEFKYEPPQ